jgi:hypothetical protein
VDRMSIVAGRCAGIDLAGCGIRAAVVMPHLLAARQPRCVARRLPPAQERRSRSEDPRELRTFSTKPSGIAVGSGGRAKHAAAPSCRCAIAPTSTARAALTGCSWLGLVINRAPVARRVEDGSSSREPSPRYGTTRRSATGWSACRLALRAMARFCRSSSGGSTPPGLRCTELLATSSTPTTRWRTAAKTRGREVRRGGRVDRPWRGQRASRGRSHPRSRLRGPRDRNGDRVIVRPPAGAAIGMPRVR